MIHKVVNSFFIGLVFVSLLDFLFFIGLKLNYFDAYGINKEYFNIIFIDNQNFYLLLPSFFIVGYLMLYCRFSKIFDKIYILFIVVSALSIYEPVGKSFGEFMFMKKGVTFRVGKVTFEGDLLYKGRKYLYIYRKDLAKTIKIKNSDVMHHMVFIAKQESL